MAVLFSEGNKRLPTNTFRKGTRTRRGGTGVSDLPSDNRPRNSGNNCPFCNDNPIFFRRIKPLPQSPRQALYRSKVQNSSYVQPCGCPFRFCGFPARRRKSFSDSAWQPLLYNMQYYRFTLTTDRLSPFLRYRIRFPTRRRDVFSLR